MPVVAISFNSKFDVWKSKINMTFLCQWILLTWIYIFTNHCLIQLFFKTTNMLAIMIAVNTTIFILSFCNMTGFNRKNLATRSTIRYLLYLTIKIATKFFVFIKYRYIFISTFLTTCFDSIFITFIYFKLIITYNTYLLDYTIVMFTKTRAINNILFYSGFRQIKDFITVFTFNIYSFFNHNDSPLGVIYEV